MRNIDLYQKRTRMKPKSKIDSKLANLVTKTFGETIRFRDRANARLFDFETEARHFRNLTGDHLEAKQLSRGLHHRANTEN